MMATGTTDPIRRATDKTWSDTLPLLTIEGSAGPDNAADAIYCQVYGGAECASWYTNSISTTDGNCKIGEANELSVKRALDNCTMLAAGQVNSECQVHYDVCLSCDNACKEAAIQDVKDEIIPASYFVFFLCFYLAIVVVWNNIMIAADDLEGLTKILGLVFNGVLCLIAFIEVIMGSMAAYNASEACQASEGGCVSDSLKLLIAIGVGLMLVAGICLAGVQLNNNLLLRIATLVMVFLSLLCLLTGLIMGISSGVVMDDMDFYYQSNYPRMRAALERADNSYCKLQKDDCTTLAGGPPGSVPPKICDEDYVCEAIEGATPMTSASVWKNMWAVAAQAAADTAQVAEQPWLEI